MAIAGEVVILIGTVFILFGVVGIIKFKSFYNRMLVTAMIDAAGVFTVLLGVLLRHGFSFFSLKVFLLMVILLIASPLCSHTIARCAYLSGYKTESQLANESDKNEDYL